MSIKHTIHKANTVGRDFVVGDLHGCYTLLMKLLDYVKFDYESDRLFSVGDLTDRGPSSIDCIRLIKQPWFFPIKGNHEDLIVRYVEESDQTIMYNGGEWLHNLSEHDQKFVSDRVKDLPNMITVEGEFHVIHSELGCDQIVSDQDIMAGEHTLSLENNIQGFYNHMWMRDIFHEAMQAEQNDELKAIYANKHWFLNETLSTIYCGHSILKGAPMKVGNHLNLDTGGFVSRQSDDYGLSIIEHKTQKVHKVNLKWIQDLSVFVV